MALEVVLARYFQMAALGADKRPIRERNHRHELVAYDTIRAPKYSLRHATTPLSVEVRNEGTKTRASRSHPRTTRVARNLRNYSQSTRQQ